MLKDSAGKDLLKGIASVATGQAYFSPAIARLMLDDYVRRVAGSSATDRYETLSEREREIFQLIAEARTNKEVAELLEISPATVETTAQHPAELDIHNTAERVDLRPSRRDLVTPLVAQLAIRASRFGLDRRPRMTEQRCRTPCSARTERYRAHGCAHGRRTDPAAPLRPDNEGTERPAL